MINDFHFNQDISHDLSTSLEQLIIADELITWVLNFYNISDRHYLKVRPQEV